MYHMNKDHLAYITHAAETMSDRMGSAPNEYEPSDEEAQKILEDVGNGGTVLVVTGEEMNHRASAALLHQVIDTEIDHWVHGASTRLIHRAAAALGFGLRRTFGDPCPPGDHRDAQLTNVYVTGRHYRRCIDCGRYFRAAD